MAACSAELCGWVNEFTPELGDLFVGHVWYCGDEYCNCSQAKITLRRKNENGFYNSHVIWEGKFYTDGEGWSKTNTELNRMAAHLRKRHNEFFHRVQWPWSAK